MGIKGGVCPVCVGSISARVFTFFSLSFVRLSILTLFWIYCCSGEGYLDWSLLGSKSSSIDLSGPPNKKRDPYDSSPHRDTVDNGQQLVLGEEMLPHIKIVWIFLNPLQLITWQDRATPRPRRPTRYQTSPTICTLLQGNQLTQV